MPTPETFDVIRSHPAWQGLSEIEKSKRRMWWVQDRLVTTGQSQDPRVKAMFEADAYRDAPEWQRPSQPVSEGTAAWRGVKGAVGETLKGALDVGTRTVRTPQQLVANLLEETMRGVTGADAPKHPLERISRPFTKTFKATTGKEPETRLSENDLINTLGEAITDPLMWTGVGLTPRIRDISRASELAKAGVPKMIPPLYGRQAREAVKVASKGTPEMMGWLGEIPKSWGTFNPQQRSLYTRLMQLGQPYIDKMQLQRVAETLANAAPEQAQRAIEILKSGDKRGINSLIAWTEAPGWKRSALKGAKGAQAEKVAGTVVGNLNEPLELAKEILKGAD